MADPVTREKGISVQGQAGTCFQECPQWRCCIRSSHSLKHSSLTCRRRHVKCDETKPICARCRFGCRTCVYGVGAPLPHRQKAKPAGEFARQDVLPANPPRQHKSLSTGERGRHSNFTSPVHHSPEGRSLSHFRDPDSGTSQPPPSEPQEALDVSVIPAVENENPSPIYGSVRTARHSVFEPNRLYSVGDDFGFPVDAGDHLQRPTGDCRTYRLLRHYVEVIGPWLDLSDAERHFTRVLPEKAFEFPILFHAIMALSARLLHNHDHNDVEIASRHYDKCVSDLIPLLENPDLSADGKVLSATVLLRMYEQLQYSNDYDPQQHLIGSWSLVELPQGQNGFDELRARAFWIYLRQDVQMAERYRRRTITSLDRCFLREFDTVGPADDDAWANRMTWIYAHVINFCFDPAADRSQARWEYQRGKLNQWKNLLPPTFKPLYYSDPLPESEDPFPTIWHLSEWHGNAFSIEVVDETNAADLAHAVFAMQTYHMARILLNLYAPVDDQKGMDRLRQNREREADLQYHSRQLCGIAGTNSWEAARIHATEHLRICSEILNSPTERTKIAFLMRETSRDTGWPIISLDD